jgi:hypothetical protein
MAAPDNIQKTIIPYADLPYSTSDGYYYVRYRVVTESVDILSAWSAKHKVPVVPISDIVGVDYDPNYFIVSDGDTVKLSWNIPDNIQLDTFDVYARWSSQNTPPTESEWDAIDWQYVITTQANSMSMTVPQPTKISTISSVTKTSTTATYTTTTDHNLVVGEWVTIDGIAPYGYNGVFQVIDVNVAAKTFKISNTTNAVITDGTGTCYVDNRYVKFWVQVPTFNKIPGPDAMLFETTGDFANRLPGLDGGTPFIA